MLKYRPIVSITIGYIIGILIGLYFKNSIVLLYLCIYPLKILKMPKKYGFKVLSIKRYFRYLKMIFTKDVIYIIIISSIISNTIVLFQENRYKNIRNDLNNSKISTYVTICSNVQEKKYKDNYIANLKEKNINVILSVNKKEKIEYGDILKVEGTFINPEKSKNYGGFDYYEYLKKGKIYGTIKVDRITKIGHVKYNFLLLLNRIYLNLKKKFDDNFDRQTAGILNAMILGEDEDVDSQLLENFSNSNISHILAISGMHIGYIIIFCEILKKIIGKRNKDILTIVFLAFYLIIIQIHPSAVRATIMAILVIFSKIIYRKSDIWNNICISLLVILIYNSYLITSVSLILSYGGTIGIIVFLKFFKFKNKIAEVFFITIFVYIFIFPILIYFFNKTSIIGLFVSGFISILVAPIIVLGFIYLLFKNEIIKILLTNLITLIIRIANFVNNLPLSKIYLPTPSIFLIISYYIILFLAVSWYVVYHYKRFDRQALKIRIRNLVSIFKYNLRENKKRICIVVIVLVFILCISNIFSKNLKIHFVDVGQGDCCLIITPHNKKILIDGGGTENDDYDVGKKVLLPYLLDKGITCIDYIMISHFDTDHVGGLLTVMENLKVENVVISRQGEDSENYKKFREIVKEKKIKVQVVVKGDRLKIENDVYFDILWPNGSKLISENILNNNSIVCKMHYKDFSILFTGDIEKIAEEQILQEYRNNLQILKSNILKVAHHGSKTSSTEEFIDAVKPKIALIGVGKNNKFGHPNDSVLEKLTKIRCENL